MHPEKIRPGQIARVTVENRGNARESLTIDWQDRGAELTFSPPQTILQVDEGQISAAEFTATPNQRRLLGGQLRHPFSVGILSSTREAQKLQGELVSRALIPIWVIPAIVFLCVILASAVGLIYNQSRVATRQSTQTAIVQLTADAALASAQDSDNEGLTDSQEIQYGTDPNNPDTDLDNVTDFEEIQGGTDPLVPDTDGDGLADGEEIRIGTNPNLTDTDGDTIPDGTEGAEGTNPRLPDTDGDGLPDNVDPDPLMAGTPTPTPTGTLQPTATPTSTPTPTPTPDITSGLLAYFPFDGSLEDQSGNGFDARRYNGANCFSFVTDREGFAERSAGIDICNNSPSPPYDYGLLLAPHIHFSENFTLSTWLWRRTNGGNNSWMIGQQNWAGLYVQQGYDIIGFRIPYDESENQTTVLDPNPTEREVWSLFTVVVSSDGNDSTLTLYRDGEFAASETAPGVIYENPSSDEFNIGSTLLNGNTRSDIFRGGLDDVTIYNRALSPEEVRYLFENGGRPIDP